MKSTVFCGMVLYNRLTRTKQRCITEGSTLHNLLYENLRSYTVLGLNKKKKERKEKKRKKFLKLANSHISFTIPNILIIIFTFLDAFLCDFYTALLIMQNKRM